MASLRFQNFLRIVPQLLISEGSTTDLWDRFDLLEVIFGSGDHYRAVTATANKHFVSSAYHQYFRVFLSM
ncbi:hypothetical protein Y032_0323g2484 [Ancylostoma ceylanicum]|uniref:Uncharacterized protein n=1 Tax=Ancylostoma ceylanicum TaxID=53326 RepID=A0A016S0U1_9BILA|nr:hypothetical protein Y032_0323g2484 [Ancylostoma ceylanicum]